MDKLTTGLWVSLYGLAGVFLVLILFYLVTKLVMLIFRNSMNK